jgi:hypothetical protein
MTAKDIRIADEEDQRLSVNAFLDDVLPRLFALYENKERIACLASVVREFYEQDYISQGGEYETRWVCK